MRKLLSLCLMILSLAASSQTMTVTGVFDYDEARSFVRAINKARLKKGINTVKFEQGLTEAAMLRAAELSTQWSPYKERQSNNIENDRPNGKKFNTLIEEHYAMPQGTHCGEWFLCSKSNPSWLSIYRDCINDIPFVFESWTSVGISVFYRDDNTYLVLLFSNHTNANSVVQSGKWKIKTQVSTVSGKKTTFLSKEEISTYEFPQTIDISGSFYYDYAAEVVRLVNNIRDSIGLPSLVMDSVLTECAMIRAAETASSNGHEIQKTNFQKLDIANTVHISGHTRPNGQRPFTILPDIYEDAGLGENIAEGQMSPQKAVNGWMNSPGHRGNILKKTYKTIGVGVFYFNGYFRWVQLFTTHQNTEPYHPSHREEITVQVSFDPAVESKVVKRKRTG